MALTGAAAAEQNLSSTGSAPVAVGGRGREEEVRGREGEVRRRSKRKGRDEERETEREWVGKEAGGGKGKGWAKERGMKEE